MCRTLYLYLSILFLLIGCISDYKLLQPSQPDQVCYNKLAPRQFQTGWYDAGVDVIGKHISGLVLLKNMPDSAVRIVFTNEAGLKFFDFEFSKYGVFRVHQVMDQLNKKSVIRTLQKDFELILGIPFRASSFTTAADGEEVFYGVVQKDETAYFITTQECASLRRLEWRVDRKRMVSVEISGQYPAPETWLIQHHTFNMQITLKRIPKE